jgi:hypothetical protein
LSNRLERCPTAPQRQRHTRRRFADNKSLKRCLDFVKKLRAVHKLRPRHGLGKFELLALPKTAPGHGTAFPVALQNEIAWWSAYRPVTKSAQPRPFDRSLALLDPLLARAALVCKRRRHSRRVSTGAIRRQSSPNIDSLFSLAPTSAFVRVFRRAYRHAQRDIFRVGAFEGFLFGSPEPARHGMPGNVRPFACSLS